MKKPVPSVSLFSEPGEFNRLNPEIKGKYKFAWVEDSLTIPTQSDGTNPTDRDSYLGKSVNPKKTSHFFILLLVGILILLGRIFYLQIWQGSEYRRLAEGNRLRILPVLAERGIIYDRFNRELVQNIPSFTLSIVPQDLPRDVEQRQPILNRVAQMSGVPLTEIENSLKKYRSAGYQSLTIKENLNYEAALTLYAENFDLPGVVIESATKRSYPITASSTASSTPSLSHLLGYLAKINDKELADTPKGSYLLSDTIGKSGLEKSYETALRGSMGKKRIEVDARGKEQTVIAIEPPVPGKNLILSLDSEAQHALEVAIKKTLATTGKTRASAIALDPQTGGILALVSWPAFDNNDFSGGIASTTYRSYTEDPNRPLFNRAIAGLFPPGSTLKMLVGLSALEEKTITPLTTVNSVGGIMVGGHLFKDWKAGGHGITSLTKALAWSVNTFFYYVGGGYQDFSGLGIDRLLNYLRHFKLNEKTGIDIPGERAGFLPNKEWKLSYRHEPWYVGDTYNLSIGQGDIVVTPLRVAWWTAFIASGKNIQPHLGETLIDSLTKKKIPLNFIADTTALADPANEAIIRQGMRECVQYGSCRALQSLPFTSAGKTGTAQWSSTRDTHAWFTAFAPYEQPKIVISVLVEEGGEGSAVSVPIARDFLSWWGKKYLTGT